MSHCLRTLQHWITSRDRDRSFREQTISFFAIRAIIESTIASMARGDEVVVSLQRIVVKHELRLLLGVYNVNISMKRTNNIWKNSSVLGLMV